MLAPTCCDTLIAVALPPWPAMSDVRSGAPLRTVADVADAQRRSGFDDDRRVRDVVERLPQSGREDQVLQAVLRIVADGLQQVRAVQRLRDVVDGQAAPRACVPGSTMTSISRVSLASTPTWPTPGTRDSAGRIT